MQTLHIIAGLGWDPAIRGILAVLTGVVVLAGSVWLLLASNTGARLGTLIALGGLFGWLTILTLMWWIQPPGIGPRGGNEPKWVPIEIYVDGGGPARTAVVNSLSSPESLPQATQILEQHPELATQVPKTPTLSDIAGASAADANGNTIKGKDLVPQRTDNGGWRVVPTSEAGEAQTAADTALVSSGFFKDATAYKKLNTFQQGGNPRREDDCPAGDAEGEQQSFIPADALCRAWARIKKTFRITSPPDYTVVQVQAVEPQTAAPGEPPPTPRVDPTQPVVSVVLIRDQGNIRLKPFVFFVISASLFAFFCMLLHFRDKTAWKNRGVVPDKAGA
ncbi:MAG: hypothetical protein R2726_22795 [Acidimicrobiales bacterium]